MLFCMCAMKLEGEKIFKNNSLLNATNKKKSYMGTNIRYEPGCTHAQLARCDYYSSTCFINFVMLLPGRAGSYNSTFRASTIPARLTFNGGSALSELSAVSTPEALTSTPERGDVFENVLNKNSADSILFLLQTKKKHTHTQAQIEDYGVVAARRDEHRRDQN